MQICPVCAMWVGTNIVDHITAQHGDLFKISFLIFIIEMLLLHQNVLICFCFLLLIVIVFSFVFRSTVCFLYWKLQSSQVKIP